MEALHSNMKWSNQMIIFCEQNCFQVVKLLVFHFLEGAKATYQCNGMITAQLFSFGSSDMQR